MPQVVVTPKVATSAGIRSDTTGAPVATTDLTGFLFYNSDRTFVVLQNTWTSNITVTAVTPMTIDGMAVPDKSITLPANGILVFCEFDPKIYNNSDGQVSIAISSFAGGAAANVLINVFQV